MLNVIVLNLGFKIIMNAELKDKLLNLSEEITHLIAGCSNLNSLENIRVNALGKKGSITSYLKDLRDYDDISKREIGSLINEIKNQINQSIFDKALIFKNEKEWFDFLNFMTLFKPMILSEI